MDTTAGYDPTLPLDLDGSCNPDLLPEVTLSKTNLELPDASAPFVMKQNSGRLSPVRAITMKEYDQIISELRKENFNLKLRIYFLEERMQQKYGDGEDIFKTNIELRVEVETLRKELTDKQDLLKKASLAMENLTTNHQLELKQFKGQVEEEYRNQTREIEDKYNQSVLDSSIYQQDLQTAEDRVASLESTLANLQKELNTLEEERDEARQRADENLECVKDKDSKLAELEELIKLKEMKRKREMEEWNERERRMEEDMKQMKKEVERKERDIQDAMEDQKETVKKLQRKLQDNEKKLSDKGNLISDLEEKLEELERENKALSNNVDQAEGKSRQLTENTLKRDKTIQGFVAAMNKKDKQITSLKDKLSQSEEEIERLKEEIHETNLANHKKLLKSLGKKDGELVGFKEMLGKAEEALKTSEVALEALQEQLKQEKLDGQTRSDKLQEHYQLLLDDVQSQLQGKEKILHQLSYRLKDKDQQLHDCLNLLDKDNLNQGKNPVDLLKNLQEKLKEKDKLTQKLHEEKQDALDEKDSEIRTLKQSVREKERDLNRANQMLLTAEDNVESLERELKEKEENMKQLSKCLQAAQKSFEDAMDNHMRAIDQKTAMINRLKSSVESKETALQDAINKNPGASTDREKKFRKQLKEKEAVIQELMNEKNDLLAESETMSRDFFNKTQIKDNSIKMMLDKHLREKGELEKEIQQLQSDLNKRDIELQRIENSGTWVEDQLEKLRESMKEKDKTIEALFESSKEKDKLLQQQTQSLSPSASSTITDMAHVQSLQDEVAFLLNHLANKDAQINQLVAKTERLPWQQEEIDRLSGELVKKNQILKEEVKEKERLEKELEETRKACEKEMKEKLERCEREISQLKEQLVAKGNNSPTDTTEMNDVLKEQLKELKNLSTLLQSEREIYLQLNHNQTSGSRDRILEDELKRIERLRETLTDNVERNHLLRIVLEQQQSSSYISPQTVTDEEKLNKSVNTSREFHNWPSSATAAAEFPTIPISTQTDISTVTLGSKVNRNKGEEFESPLNQADNCKSDFSFDLLPKSHLDLGRPLHDDYTERSSDLFNFRNQCFSHLSGCYGDTRGETHNSTGVSSELNHDSANLNPQETVLSSNKLNKPLHSPPESLRLVKPPLTSAPTDKQPQEATKERSRHLSSQLVRGAPLPSSSSSPPLHSLTHIDSPTHIDSTNQDSHLTSDPRLRSVDIPLIDPSSLDDVALDRLSADQTVLLSNDISNMSAPSLRKLVSKLQNDLMDSIQENHKLHSMVRREIPGKNDADPTNADLQVMQQKVDDLELVLAKTQHENETLHQHLHLTSGGPGVSVLSPRTTTMSPPRGPNADVFLSPSNQHRELSVDELKQKLSETERNNQLLRQQIQLNTKTSQSPGGLNPELILEMAQEIERLQKLVKKQTSDSDWSDAGMNGLLAKDGTASPDRSTNSRRSLVYGQDPSKSEWTAVRDFVGGERGEDGDSLVTTTTNPVKDRCDGRNGNEDIKREGIKYHGNSNNEVKDIKYHGNDGSEVKDIKYHCNSNNEVNDGNSSTDIKDTKRHGNANSNIPRLKRATDSTNRPRPQPIVANLDGEDRTTLLERLLVGAKAQIAQLEEKLSATENTVRFQSSKMKYYRNLASDAGLIPKLSSRSQSETNLLKAANQQTGDNKMVYGSCENFSDFNDNGSSSVTTDCSKEYGKTENVTALKTQIDELINKLQRQTLEINRLRNKSIDHTCRSVSPPNVSPRIKQLKDQLRESTPVSSRNFIQSVRRSTSEESQPIAEQEYIQNLRIRFPDNVDVRRSVDPRYRRSPSPLQSYIGRNHRGRSQSHSDLSRLSGENTGERSLEAITGGRNKDQKLSDEFTGGKMSNQKLSDHSRKLSEDYSGLKHSELSERCKRLTEELSEVKNFDQKLTERCEKLTQELSEVKRDNSTLAARLVELGGDNSTSSIETWKKKVADLESEKESLMKKLDKATQEVMSLQKEANEREREKVVMETKVRRLEQTLKWMERQQGSVSADRELWEVKMELLDSQNACLELRNQLEEISVFLTELISYDRGQSDDGTSSVVSGVPIDKIRRHLQNNREIINASMSDISRLDDGSTGLVRSDKYQSAVDEINKLQSQLSLQESRSRERLEEKEAELKTLREELCCVSGHGVPEGCDSDVDTPSRTTGSDDGQPVSVTTESRLKGREPYSGRGSEDTGSLSIEHHRSPDNSPRRNHLSTTTSTKLNLQRMFHDRHGNHARTASHSASEMTDLRPPASPRSLGVSHSAQNTCRSSPLSPRQTAGIHGDQVKPSTLRDSPNNLARQAANNSLYRRTTDNFTGHPGLYLSKLDESDYLLSESYFCDGSNASLFGGRAGEGVDTMETRSQVSDSSRARSETPSQSDIHTLKTRLNIVEEANRTLREEINMYEHIANASSGQRSPRGQAVAGGQGSGQRGQGDDLHLHLMEMRALRVRLEKSLDESERLRLELEERMKADGSGSNEEDYIQRIKELDILVSNLQTRLDDRESVLREKLTIIEEHEKIIHETQVLLEEKNGEIEETQQQYHDTEQHVFELEASLSESQKKLQESQRHRREAEEMCQELEQRNRTAEKRCMEFEQRQKTTEKRCHELDQQQKTTEKRFLELEQRHKTTEKRCHDAERRCQELQRHRQDSESTLQDLERRNEELRDYQKRLEDRERKMEGNREQIEKNFVKCQQRKEKQETQLKKAGREIKKLLQENALWKEKAEEKTELSKTLKLELSMYERMNTETGGSESNLDIRELFTEIRHLRVQLEKCIEANNHLRETVETLLHQQHVQKHEASLSSPSSSTASDAADGRPSPQNSPKKTETTEKETITHRRITEKTYEYDRHGYDYSKQSSPRDRYDRQDTNNNPNSSSSLHRSSLTDLSDDIRYKIDVPRVEVDSDIRRLFAIGRLDDFEKIRKENEEVLTVLSGLEARVLDRIDSVKKSTEQSVEYSTLKEIAMTIENLKICIEAEKMMVQKFWVSQLPPVNELGEFYDAKLAEDNRCLRKELAKIKTDYDMMSRSAREAEQRLQLTNRQRQGMEQALCQQLSRTNKILKQASCNFRSTRRSGEQGESLYLTDLSRK